jgi:chemotaxis protein MotB
MINLTPQELKKRLDLSERRRIGLQRVLLRNHVDEDNLFWTMADLMTLLLVFFVLLYSRAISIKPETLQVVAERQAIATPKEKEPQPKVQEPAPPTPVLQDTPPEDVAPEKTTGKNREMDEIEQEALQAIDAGDAENISVRWTNNQLVFVLAEKITFSVGEAELVDTFHPALSRIATFIAAKDGYRISVSGHTDDTPIHTALFPSNWELSAGRAVTVARFLIAHGVPADRLSIQGFAEYKPLYENTTPENRQSNRRVEITLIKEHKSD